MCSEFSNRETLPEMALPSHWSVSKSVSASKKTDKRWSLKLTALNIVQCIQLSWQFESSSVFWTSFCCTINNWKCCASCIIRICFLFSFFLFFVSLFTVVWILLTGMHEISSVLWGCKAQRRVGRWRLVKCTAPWLPCRLYQSRSTKLSNQVDE